MKNEIVTCLKNEHPIYDNNFQRHNIKVGKAYKCVDEGYMIVHTRDGKTLTTHGNQFYYEPSEVIKQLQTLLGL